MHDTRYRYDQIKTFQEYVLKTYGLTIWVSFPNKDLPFTHMYITIDKSYHGMASVMLHNNKVKRFETDLKQVEPKAYRTTNYKVILPLQDPADLAALLALYKK